MKTTSLLPLFTGFYESIFDPANSIYEQEYEYLTTKEGMTDEEVTARLREWNYRAAYIAISKDIAEGFAELMHDHFPELELKVSFVELISPIEYNFETDKIVVDLEFKTDELLKLVLKHECGLQDFIEAQFTPRSGFQPYYSNKLQDWKDDIKALEELDTVQIWTLFSALCEAEGLDDETLYDQVQDRIDETFCNEV